MLAIKHQIQSTFDIITLSETFLSATSSQDLSLQGYHQIIRKDRNTFGGGVAAFISNDLAYKHISDLEIVDNETLWLQVNAKNNKFLLAVTYRPPNSGINYLEEMQTMYDGASQGNIPIIIIGDMNSHPQTRNGELLNDFAISNFLTLHVDQPTRITETTSSILDQLVSNIPHLIKDVTVHPPLCTNDHCTISANINFKLCKQESYERNIWNYNTADYIGFNEAIRNYDWSVCFDTDDINQCLTKWTTSFLNLARSLIPNKTVLIRTKDTPWFTKDLRKLKREKDMAHNLAKQTNLPVAWNNFRKIRNTYTGKLREAEFQYKRKLANKLENPATINPKQWWHLTKQFLGKHNSDSIPPLTDPASNNTIFDNKDK